MTKELYVSSTPHETKVGLVEDDQLAEIYLERENEYTLAGSIYKGRVTRVLPGMQSAFVDIGLERDAFLYVSDFMELEDADEVEELPANQPAGETRYQPRVEAQTSGGEVAGSSGLPEPHPEPRSEVAAPATQNRESSSPAERGGEESGGWRGRRRRRGRRGERMPESKFERPAGEPSRETPREPQRSARPERPERPERDRSERDDYGPPPGYQPILLPGESISKYQRLAQAQAAAPPTRPEPAPARSKGPESPAPVANVFPDDEPLFTGLAAEPQPAVAALAERDLENARAGWGREPERPALRNPPASTSAGFDGPVADQEIEEEEADSDDRLTVMPEHSDRAPVDAPGSAASAGTLEEEEIEEEEADLTHYVEDLEEDAVFEEMEEETRAADDYRQSAGEIAAAGEPGTESSGAEVDPFRSEAPVATDAQAPVGEEEADDAAEAEAELEEAQAEAEALLDAEARGNGTVEARAEVRAPAGAAAYTQRTQRPGFDRDRRPGPRGRRGGRRFRSRENQPVPQITDLLKEGQEILVQIAKEPIGKKGARITSHIALPGRFLVYMPTVNHTGVSRKIASEEERQRLKRIIISERENGYGGFIVRTAAQGASEDELRADIRFLKGLWTEIKTRADNDKAPLLIYHDLNVVERVLRDQVTSDFSAIWVDTEQEYERILRFANRFQPALVKRVKLYSKETPLFEQFGLNDEINKALKSKVWLKSGGYIVINQTEALVAIDVNTGKYVGKTARLEDTIVKTNVDAIKEIVRQIRLRDLGGIIIIDFIDMDERRNRQRVMQALEEALRGDRAPSKVLQFNDFGLVAITRKRVKQSLERTIGSPCPYCESTGYVKSVTTVCNDIYIEMRKMAKHLDHTDVMLRVNPEVAKALKANSGRALLEMEELTKKTVIVKSDPALHQEQFDIN
jgi:Rne/Rng family ribonuclease